MALKMLRAVARDRRGATAVEYGLIASLVVVAIMASILLLADETTSLWNNISTKVLATL